MATRRRRRRAIVRRRAPARTRVVYASRPRRRRRVRRYARRVGRAARRGASVAARATWDEKHTLFAALTGAALGAIHGRDIEDTLKKIPGVSFLTLPGVIGIILFLLSKFIKTGTFGKLTRHGATGCFSIAAYILGSKYLGKSAVSGVLLGEEDEEISGYL